MIERDIEKDVTPTYFAATLRRLADAIEGGEPFTIQVANQKIDVPVDASLVVEHEVENGVEELAFEVQWGEPVDEEE